jgi:hypothetical protein
MRQSKPKNNSGNSFIAEIKTQFERELSVKDTLDRKSANMITMSSSISAAIIAIATFALAYKLTINNDFAVITISIALTIGMSAIGLFIWSYHLRNYQYPLGHEIFFKDKGNGKYRKDIVNNWQSSSTKTFNDRIVEEYLSSIKTNANSNKSKARALEFGQWVFLCSIAMVSFWLIISLIMVLMAS